MTVKTDELEFVKKMCDGLNPEHEMTLLYTSFLALGRNYVGYDIRKEVI